MWRDHISVSALPRYLQAREAMEHAFLQTEHFATSSDMIGGVMLAFAVHIMHIVNQA
jgi:hypothetical protein